MKLRAWVLLSCLLGSAGAFSDTTIGVGVSRIDYFNDEYTGVGTDISGKFSDFLGYAVSSQIGGSGLDYFVAAKLRGGITLYSLNAGAGEGFLYLTVGRGHAALTNGWTYNDAVYGIGFESFFGANGKWGLGLEYNRGAGDDFDGGGQLAATMRYRF